MLNIELEWNNVRKIFWVSLAIRLLLLFALVTALGESALLFSDTREYLSLADSLRQGTGFLFEGASYTLRTPGYPVFLAALGGSSAVLFISVIQIVIASTIPVLTYILTKRLGFEERIATIAAWVTAVEPHMVYYSIPILPDAFFTVFFLVFLLLAVRWLKKPSTIELVGVSFFFAVLLYIKPVLQALPLYLGMVTLAAAFFKKSWEPIKHFVPFAVIVALLASPWMYRNAMVDGHFSMSTQGPVLVASKLATSVMSVSDRITFDEAERVLEARWDKARPMPMKDVSAYLLQHPTALMRVLAMNSLLLWTSQTYTYIPNYYGFLPLPPSYNVNPPSVLLLQGRVTEFISSMFSILRYPYIQFAILGKVMWTLIAGFFFYGLTRQLMDRKKTSWDLHVFIALLVLCYTMTTWIDGFNVEARLRYPFNPLMFIYGTMAILLIIRFLRRIKTSYE